MARLPSLFKVIPLCLAIAVGAICYWLTASANRKIVILSPNGLVASVVIDLGEVYDGERVDRQFIVKNGTGAAMRLEGKTSCGCTSVQIDQKQLAAGDEIVVRVVFDTAATPGTLGKVEQAFVIRDALGTDHNVRLEGVMRAVIKPTLSLGPGTLRWSVEPGDTVKSQALRVKNETGSPIQFQTASPPRPGMRFTITPAQAALAAGAEVELTVTPDADLRELPYVAVAEFISQMHEGTRSRQVKHLVGVQVVQAVVVRTVPGSLIFAKQDIGTAKTLRVTVEIARPVVVKRVTADNECIQIVDKNKKENWYEVRVERSISAHFTSGNVLVEYEVNGQLQCLRVPVFVVP